jgi:hypothetical protein
MACVSVCLDRSMSHQYNFPSIPEGCPQILVRDGIARKKSHEENRSTRADPADQKTLRLAMIRHICN